MPVNPKEFENAVLNFIQPVDSGKGPQLPRPWFTAFSDPLNARVFIVGANQRNSFDPDKISINRHFDGLFSRNGETCLGIYKEATGGGESPTRSRIQKYISGKLYERGVKDIIETNVVCRSSQQFSDLNPNEKSRGSEIFRYLLNSIRPIVLIIFGKGARKQFAKSISLHRENWADLDQQLAEVFPNKGSAANSILVNDTFEVYCIPGLVQAGWNEWSDWIDEYTDKLADAVSECLVSADKKRLDQSEQKLFRSAVFNESSPKSKKKQNDVKSPIYNPHIGRLGELHAALRLTLAGWSVHNINDATANSANSDLLIYTEDGKSHYVSVKATNTLDEIRLTNRGDEGQSIFNTKSGGPVSDFVLFVAGADQIEPRVFMLPIKVAKNMFAELRKHSYARKRERGSSIKFPYLMIHTRPPLVGKRKYKINERLTAKLLKYEGVLEPK